MTTDFLQESLTNIIELQQSHSDELIALRIEVEKGKSSANTFRLVSGAFVALVCYIYIGNNASIEKWNYSQDSNIAANQQAIAGIQNRITQLEVKKDITHTN